MMGIKRPNQGPTVQLCKEPGIVKYGGSCYVEEGYPFQQGYIKGCNSFSVAQTRRELIIPISN